MYYEEENNYPKAFLATGIIFAVMIALCYFIVFQAPPVLEDGIGGIVVNYGTADEGMGKDVTSTEEPSVSPRANHSQPTKVTQAQPNEQKTKVDNSNEKIVTQNNEDAPEVAANSKKASKAVATGPAKPVKKQVSDPRAEYHGPTHKGSGGGDGTTNTAGNQGTPKGSPLAADYGNGGTGNGVGGTQWSFVSMPDIKNTNRTPGMVYIDVTIDEKGNIIEAHADKKTRMGDLGLINKCINLIKNSKLTSSTPGSGVQKGQIPIKFDVD